MGRTRSSLEEASELERKRCVEVRFSLVGGKLGEPILRQEVHRGEAEVGEVLRRYASELGASPERVSFYVRGEDGDLETLSAGEEELEEEPAKRRLEELAGSERVVLINVYVAPEIELEPWKDAVAGDLSVSSSLSSSSSSPRERGSEEKGAQTVEESSPWFELELSGGGIVGLKNFNNTCYMNSAIQCLSQVWPLTEYFLSQQYKSDINPDNPLGKGGLLAREYAGLLGQLWLPHSTCSPVQPLEFYRSICDSYSQFADRQQHDVQEFLEQFLDGLHEDLNLRASRNESIVIDLFQGQYESTLTCPTCHYVSSKFDSFRCLSLPLPTESPSVTVSVTFHPLKQNLLPSKSTLVLFEPPFNVRAVKCALDSDKFLFCTLSHSPLRYVILSDNDDVQDQPIHAFELFHPVSQSSTYVCIYFVTYPHVTKLSIFTFLSVSVPITTQSLYHLISDCFGVYRLYDTCYLFYFCPHLQIAELLPTDPTPLSFSHDTSMFLLLHLNPPSPYRTFSPPIKRPPSRSRTYKLLDCFDSLVKAETLDEDNKWLCPRCKEPRQAVKKIDLSMLPKFLIIHLKRFEYHSIHGCKIDSPVQYPVSNLDLTPYTTTPQNHLCVYDLIAVSIHMGNLDSGHYIAYGLNPRNQTWYLFDDTRVSPLTSSPVNQNAYVLIYKRR